MSRREYYEEQKLKKIVKVFAITLVLSIVAFLSIFVMYNKKLKTAWKGGKFMENKPSYEELLRLYKAEQDKNTKLEKALSEKDKEILELEAKMFEQNILINKLLKKIEDKDIKLKKQLCDRFGIKSDKKEKVVVNEAEELSTRKFKAKKKRGRKEGTQDASCFDVS